MPPLPRLRVGLLRELERELRFAPREAIVRDVERVEALAPELDPDTSYPADWVVFRITGYRPGESAGRDAPTLISGGVLIGDLSSFAEHLSVAAGMTREEEVARGGLAGPALLARWRVSRATLNRMRRLGLVARRTRSKRGTSALVFTRGVVERFEGLHRGRLERAGLFTRVSPREARRILRDAERYQRCLGFSIGASARRIAARHGRSVEGIRSLLLRERVDSADGPRVLDALLRRVVLRAFERGGEVRTLAQRFARSPASIRRALTLARVERLRRRLAPAPTPARVAQDAVLRSRAVGGGLGRAGERDLRAFLESARSEMGSEAAVEHDRLAAMRFLIAGAAHRLHAIDLAHPSPGALDEVETSLRWAARLKAELLRPQLRLVLETIEARLGRRIESIRPALIPTLLRIAIDASAVAVGMLDPARGGRVAGAVGLAVDRAVLSWSRAHVGELSVAGARRAEIILPQGIAIRDWTRSLAPWQRAVEPSPRVRSAVERGTFSEADAAWLADRFGWRGSPPKTLAQLAAEGRTSATRSAIRERALVRAAR